MIQCFWINGCPESRMSRTQMQDSISSCAWFKWIRFILYTYVLYTGQPSCTEISLCWFLDPGENRDQCRHVTSKNCGLFCEQHHASHSANLCKSTTTLLYQAFDNWSACEVFRPRDAEKGTQDRGWGLLEANWMGELFLKHWWPALNPVHLLGGIVWDRHTTLFGKC